MLLAPRVRQLSRKLRIRFNLNETDSRDRNGRDVNASRPFAFEAPTMRLGIMSLRRDKTIRDVGL